MRRKEYAVSSSVLCRVDAQQVSYVQQCMDNYREMQNHVHIVSIAVEKAHNNNNNNSIYLYSAIYLELKSCSEALITTSECL